MTKLEEKVLDMWLSGSTVAEIALMTGKTIMQIATILQKFHDSKEQKQTTSSNQQTTNNLYKLSKSLQRIKSAQVVVEQLQEEVSEKLQLSVEKNPEVLELLQQALMDEFQQWDLYYAYKSQLRGMARDPVDDHFKDHADEEASHIEILQRYIVGYGEQPTTQRKPIPSLGNKPSMEEIVKLQLSFEQNAVDTYRKLLTHLEETDPLRIEIENILAQEQEHVHDLDLLLKGDSNA